MPGWLSLKAEYLAASEVVPVLMERAKTAEAGWRPAALAGAWMLMIGVVSFLPRHVKNELHSTGRFHSWEHFVVFGLGAFLLAHAGRTVRGTVILLSFALLAGCLIEFGQHLVYRSAIEWSDMAADGCGLACGAVLFLLSRSRSID